ncbi:hypothetical protein P4679_25710 [Priestia megaterium]|uniref:hypothetical protein n=1 Tax=Priestia megaterium TaxID=1404 RepID=UPI002E1BBBA8|nr:hypothetical protein [Priestia megaterium]
MKRIALVTSSKARKEKPTIAKEFYQGSYNHWVNKIIKYIEKRGMEDVSYFLNFDGQRIISFNEVINYYPVSEKRITADEKNTFALKILDFLLRFKEKPFVELHTGKDISVSLCKLLDEYGFSYKIYAESVPLGKKPGVYENLIEKEDQKLRAKEIKRGRLRLVHSLEYQTPAQAEIAIKQYETNPDIYEPKVVASFEELKAYRKKHYNRSKDMRKALNEFEGALNLHIDGEELQEFIQETETLQGLYKEDPRYEYFNKKFNKELSKYEYYKIKQGYVVSAEYRIHTIMHRLSILLMKKNASKTKSVKGITSTQLISSTDKTLESEKPRKTIKTVNGRKGRKSAKNNKTKMLKEVSL